MSRETRTTLRDLGLRIRELRRRAELTQEQVAERLGMLAPNYARIEQGRANVTVDTLVRISNALGLELIELFKAPKDRVVRPGRPRATGRVAGPERKAGSKRTSPTTARRNADR